MAWAAPIIQVCSFGLTDNGYSVSGAREQHQLAHGLYWPGNVSLESWTMHDRKAHHPERVGSHAADQRLDEIAGLLAAGILRLHISRAQAAIAEAKKNPSARREKQLAARARKSVHRSRTRV